MHVPFLPIALGGTLASASSLLLPRQSQSITVDLTTTYQEMDGFGMSEAFQRAVQMQRLTPEKQREALDLLFSTTKGAGFTILRNGIGSSTSSESDWMNTIAPTNPGGPEAELEYVWDGEDSGQLWVAREAQDTYGVRTFYANAWSAPAYMKTNGQDTNGGSLCGVSGTNCPSGNWIQSYSNYLVQLIQFYKDEGITITHLGFLNEPELATYYASMLSNGQQAADVIRVLRPTLDAAGFEDVKLTCCDPEGWNHMSSMLGSLGGVEDMFNLVTAHSYTSQPGSPLRTPHKVWQTEAADLQGAWTSAWSGFGAGVGMTWANSIYDAVVRSNCSAYLYWVGVQGGDTNSKLIRIDGNGNLDASKRLWAFANWSRGVRPGALRVGTSGGGGQKVSGFLNTDGRVAVQIINSGGAMSVEVKVEGGAMPTEGTGWVTDDGHECDTIGVVVEGGVARADLPGNSMVTVVVWDGTAVEEEEVPVDEEEEEVVVEVEGGDSVEGEE